LDDNCRLQPFLEAE